MFHRFDREFNVIRWWTYSYLSQHCSGVKTRCFSRMMSENRVQILKKVPWEKTDLKTRKAFVFSSNHPYREQMPAKSQMLRVSVCELWFLHHTITCRSNKLCFTFKRYLKKQERSKREHCCLCLVWQRLKALFWFWTSLMVKHAHSSSLWTVSSRLGVSRANMHISFSALSQLLGILL